MRMLVCCLVFVTPHCSLIVIEFCKHGSLDAMLYQGVQQREFEMRELRTIVLNISNGVRHLHRHGVIHRDLAARNILLGKGFVAKVTDFGMVRFDHRSEGDGTIADSRSLATYTVFGPIRWMAPEQIG